MDRDALVQQVQLNILERYDVLLECSEIDDNTLSKLSKRLPKANGNHATFARWCDHVLGDHRPAVARFEHPVAGQTHIDTLRLGLRPGLASREKILAAQVRQLQKQVDTLQAQQLPAPTHAQPVPDDQQIHWIHAWQYFYAGRRDMLQTLLADVRDIEGHIFAAQGKRNCDYRQVLNEGIRYMLQGLERLGFIIDVRLTTFAVHGLTSQCFDYHRTQEQPSHFDQLFSFEVAEMPTDILTPLPIEISEKSMCKVSVYRGGAERASPEEIQHIGAFLHRMFAALAKAADHVPRGGLREHLLLALMLSWSAPWVSLDDMQFSTVYTRPDLEPVEPNARTARQSTEMSPLGVFRSLAKAVALHSGY